MTKERKALEFIAAHDFDGAADFVIARIAEVLVLKAKEALAKPKPQPKQESAGVTIEASLRFRLDSEKQKSSDLLDDVRELKGIIEKLRTPLTKDQRLSVFAAAEEAMAINPNLAWRDALVIETEAAHIGAKP